jgi:hypothetical protein
VEFPAVRHLNSKSRNMKAILALFLLLFAGSAWSQMVLKIEAVDKMTKDPVQHAMVYIATSSVKMEKPLYTGRNGVAYYTISGKDSLQIRCEHTAYSTETRKSGTERSQPGHAESNDPDAFQQSDVA